MEAGIAVARGFFAAMLALLHDRPAAMEEIADQPGDTHEENERCPGRRSALGKSLMMPVAPQG